MIPVTRAVDSLFSPPSVGDFRSSIDGQLSSLASAAGRGTLLMCAVALAWAAFVPLSSAIMTSGHVIVDGETKKIQHPTGGVVAALRVKDGDKVKEGDVLISIDPTESKANYDMWATQYLENTARAARLRAERDNAAEVTFPPSLTSDAAARDVITSELKVFSVAKTARDGQRKELEERVKQLRIEVSSLSAQAETKGKEIAMMSEELNRLSLLYKRYLVPEVRLLSVKRDLVRLKSERDALIAQVSKAEGAIAETRIQILGIDQRAAADASKELREVEDKLSDVKEQRGIAADRLNRVDIKAPVSGVVHELAVHTIGGVLKPADTLMVIVPENGALAFETRVSPNDIDQIEVGQPARIRFTAFNQRTTPELTGEVALIAPDTSRDALTGQIYYTVRLTLPEEVPAKLRHTLVPGMPVEAHITGASRTALSYLFKPLTDNFNRALVEP